MASSANNNASDVHPNSELPTLLTDESSSNKDNQGKQQTTNIDNEKDAIHPVTKFVTTSSVLDTINAALMEEMEPSSSATSATSADSTNNKRGDKRQFFELQKRMPDGSARPATDEEITSADMKNKIEQAAQLTSKMTWDQKVEWANKQRQSGNALYQEKRYKEAIDIYLTCLVVRDMSDAGKNTTTTKDAANDKMDSANVDLEVLILPVMNNLAQCALQLGWYHKAELFCTLALEASEKDEKDSRGSSIAKLYFKRGKARRLRGWYDEAKGDLDRALVALDTSNTSFDSNGEAQKPAEQKAIEREMQLLQRAIVEGKKNKKRAQRAMQKVLGSSREEKPGALDTNRDDTQSSSTMAQANPKPDNSNKTKAKDTTTPLYHEKHARTHSKIRKRPEGPPPYKRTTCSSMDLSYWQMYRLVAARVAQRILDIIGEEEGSGFGANAGENGADERQRGKKED